MAGSEPFPHLFSPFVLGGREIRNRIVFTAHHTHLGGDEPTPELAAYYEARARGGAGLIVSEACGVHDSGFFAAHMIQGHRPAAIPGFRAIAEACHRHGALILGQLFHPGREVRVKADGVTQVAVGPSAVPGERSRVMPRVMSKALIASVVEGYGATAGHMAQAGYAGVEILASQGYLPAQFLSPAINLRDDRYGGSPENRLRFLREALAAARAAIGERILGIRISTDSRAHDAHGDDETIAYLRMLEDDGVIDYISLVQGSASSLGSSVHIVPPMEWEAGYVVDAAARVKAALALPVIVTGRINQPQLAEQVLARGQADLVGMTRAQIADPEMASKARQGRSDDIRACIGCNQACSGHGLHGMAISCIQHPASGRELRWGNLPPAARPRRIMVVGAGPAGLKAAAVAAARGHEVTLYERERLPGGQVRLAERLPGRAEFGGLTTNLVRECELAGVAMVLGETIDAERIRREAPDAVVLATGARPYRPEIEGAQEARVHDAWQVIADEANIGRSVVIADTRADWIAMGTAEKLALAGCRVRLCTTGIVPGETLQQYVRDSLAGRLHSAGVEVIPYARLFGVDESTAFFQHVVTGAAIVLEETDSLVLSLGQSAESALEDSLAGWQGEVVAVGDCLSPRTAEEAVYEGFRAGFSL